MHLRLQLTSIKLPALKLYNYCSVNRLEPTINGTYNQWFTIPVDDFLHISCINDRRLRYRQCFGVKKVAMASGHINHTGKPKHTTPKRCQIVRATHHRAWSKPYRREISFRLFYGHFEHTSRWKQVFCCYLARRCWNHRRRILSAVSWANRRITSSKL